MPWWGVDLVEKMEKMKKKKRASRPICIGPRNLVSFEL
jgi:hypothetical protein